MDEERPQPRRPLRRFGPAWICASMLTLLAFVLLTAALVLPELDQARSSRTAEPVGGAALFEALTNAGPPGLADELRAIRAQLDQAGAPAESSRRLGGAIDRLGQTEVVPAIVLARLADRLDTAMDRLREGGVIDGGLPPRLLQLAAALGLAAAVLALSATPLALRSDLAEHSTPAETDISLFAHPVLASPACYQDMPPIWLANLPQDLAAAVRDAVSAAVAPRSDRHGPENEPLESAVLAGARLTGAALNAEARLDAASRRAEAALLATSEPAVIPGGDLSAGVRLCDVADRIERVLPHLAAAAAQVVEAAPGPEIVNRLRALPVTVDRLESIVSLSGLVPTAPGPIGDDPSVPVSAASSVLAEAADALRAAAGRVASASDEAVRHVSDEAARLAAAVRPLAALAVSSLDHLHSAGARIESQTQAAAAALAPIERLAALDGRLNAAADAMLEIVRGLPETLARAPSDMGRSGPAAGEAALPIVQIEDQVAGVSESAETATAAPEPPALSDPDRPYETRGSIAARLLTELNGDESVTFSSSLMAILRQLDGVEAGISRLATQAEGLVETPDGGMPESVARHAPALLAEVQQSVGRLQSVSTALAIACDGDAYSHAAEKRADEIIVAAPPSGAQNNAPSGVALAQV